MEPFVINGFYESGIISFIKIYDRLVFQDEEGAVFGDSEFGSVEIHYYGNFNEEENLFQGIWEMHMSEEKKGLQESYTDEFERGEWDLRETE